MTNYIPYIKIPVNTWFEITKDDQLIIIWRCDNSSTKGFIKSHDNLLISLESWDINIKPHTINTGYVI